MDSSIPSLDTSLLYTNDSLLGSPPSFHLSDEDDLMALLDTVQYPSHPLSTPSTSAMEIPPFECSSPLPDLLNSLALPTYSPVSSVPVAAPEDQDDTLSTLSATPPDSPRAATEAYFYPPNHNMSTSPPPSPPQPSTSSQGAAQPHHESPVVVHPAPVARVQPQLVIPTCVAVSAFTDPPTTTLALASAARPFSDVVAYVHSPFTLEHLNFSKAVAGIKSRSAKHKRIASIRMWIRDVCLKAFELNPAAMSRSTYRQLARGPYLHFTRSICPVYRCRNRKNCIRMHYCLECAVLYNIQSASHQWGSRCPTYQLMLMILD
jgi:hypothetical protein